MITILNSTLSLVFYYNIGSRFEIFEIHTALFSLFLALKQSKLTKDFLNLILFVFQTRYFMRQQERDRYDILRKTNDFCQKIENSRDKTNLLVKFEKETECVKKGCDVSPRHSYLQIKVINYNFY